MIESIKVNYGSAEAGLVLQALVLAYANGDVDWNKLDDEYFVAQCDDWRRVLLEEKQRQTIAFMYDSDELDVGRKMNYADYINTTLPAIEALYQDSPHQAREENDSEEMYSKWALHEASLWETRQDLAQLNLRRQRFELKHKPLLPTRRGRKLSAAANYESYQNLKSDLITNGVRLIGRALHIAARQSFHHEGPIGWGRCHGALEATRGAEDLLVDREKRSSIHEKEITRLMDPRQTSGSEQNFSRSHFFGALRQYGPIAHLLAAMDVIWCYPYMPPDNRNLHQSWRTRYHDNQPDNIAFGFHPMQTFMDSFRDQDILRATLLYAEWFRVWGLSRGSRKDRSSLLRRRKPLSIIISPSTERVIPTSGIPIVEYWDTFCVKRDILSSYTYRCRYERTQDGQLIIPDRVRPLIDIAPNATNIFPIPLPPLPNKLVDALASYRDVHHKGSG